jgi:uncharacterized protein (TIGR03032 family)
MSEASESPAATDETVSPQAKVQVSCTPGFLEWLAAENVSVAFTTYQTNRLFLIGRTADGQLSAFERLLDRPMGLAADGSRLWVATRFQLWRFDQVLGEGATHQGRDRLYVPRIGHVTGEVDAHDVHFTGDGLGPDVIFVNTLYNCLAKLSDRHSFEPVWTPPWISELLPEDRSHLNGLAMDGGKPRFVTAVSTTDRRHGWRDHRTDGGVVVDVDSKEIVASGLSMPHSPRVHEGELYVFDSGNGEMARVDQGSGAVEPIVFCPGYLRGLAFRGRHALVGLSKPRDKTFRGLPLDDKLANAQVDPICALQVIDLDRGEVVHELRLHGVVTELYDVAILPDTERPMALGFKSDEIRRVITFEQEDRVTHHNLQRLEQGQARMGGAPLPERATSSAKPAADGQRIAAQTIEVSLSEALAHADLTFPNLRRTVASRPLREPLLATVLLDGAQVSGGSGSPLMQGPLAVAVTNRRPGGETAEIVSFAVRSDLRGRGLGKLLLGSVETMLAQRGLRGVDLLFRDTWDHTPALRRLLAGRGWTTPKTEVLLAGTDWGFMDQDWVGKRPLPDGYEIFPWKDLGAERRREIVHRQQEASWYPEALSPFQMEERIDPEVSVGLSHGGRVVGWMVAHRVSDEVVQYTSLFVEPGHGKLGRGLPLVAEAARRQVDAGVPRGIFMVQADNTAMRRLIDRRLGEYLTDRAEMLRSGKRLAGGGG